MTEKLSRLLLTILLALPLVHEARADTITYYHNDILGSPVAATNQSGQVIWRENYRPYGERLVKDAQSLDNSVWYTSKPQDADTGLVYLGARYYDPVVGRFIATDPKGFDEANVQSFNRYAYANNNPYKFVDPNGHNPIFWFALEVAKSTGAGYLLGVAADGLSQAAAFGSVDWGMAATSSSAQAGGEAGLLGGLFSGAGAARGALQAGKTSGQVGREGEAAVRGAYDIGEKAKITINGRTRIPDGLKPGESISEVKNVESLSLTRQLRDYLDYARSEGLRFDLYTRPNTTLSGPLRDAVDSGFINHLFIP